MTESVQTPNDSATYARKIRSKAVILRYPNDTNLLRRVAMEVPNDLDPADYQRIADDLVQAMLDHDGLGIAAPQLNHCIRVIVVAREAAKGLVRIDGEEALLGEDHMVFFNPKITWASAEQAINDEGCLSFPGAATRVLRPVEIKVRYMDYKNPEQTYELHATGLFAQAIQHEMDHLDGKLLIDYVPVHRRAKFIKSVQR